jgi:hypothetical protein
MLRREELKNLHGHQLLDDLSLPAVLRELVLLD